MKKYISINCITILLCLCNNAFAQYEKFYPYIENETSRSAVKFGDNLITGGDYSYFTQSGNTESRMMMSTIVRSTGSLLSALVFSRTPFNKNYDQGYQVIINDGERVIVGTANADDPDVEDVIVIKVDNSDNVVWTKAIGDYDRAFNSLAYNAINLSNDDILIVGYSEQDGVSRQPFAARLRGSDGNVEWSRTYPATAGGVNFEYSLSAYGISNVEIDGDDILLTGAIHHSSDLYNYLMMRVDGTTGNLEWAKTVELPDNDGLVQPLVFEDNIYIVGGVRGYSTSTGPQDICLLSIDKNGTTVNFHKRYRSTDNRDEFGSNIALIEDIAFLISGSTYIGNTSEYYMMRVGLNGALSSYHRRYGHNNRYDFASYQRNLVLETYDGPYYLVGISNFIGDHKDMYIVAADQSLEAVCDQNFPVEESSQEPELVDITEEFIVIEEHYIGEPNYTTSKLCLFEQNYCDQEESRPVKIEPQEGRIKPVQFPTDLLGLKYSPNPGNVGSIISFDIGEKSAKVTLEVLDVNGRILNALISNKTISGKQSISWPEKSNDVAEGIYFVKLTVNGIQVTQRVVILN